MRRTRSSRPKRLTQDWDQAEQELAGFLAELPAPRCRAAKLHPHGGPRPAAITKTEIGEVPTAAISGPDGVGHAAIPAGGHTRTHHPNMFANKRR